MKQCIVNLGRWIYFYGWFVLCSTERGHQDDINAVYTERLTSVLGFKNNMNKVVGWAPWCFVSNWCSVVLKCLMFSQVTELPFHHTLQLQLISFAGSSLSSLTCSEWRQSLTLWICPASSTLMGSFCCKLWFTRHTFRAEAAQFPLSSLFLLNKTRITMQTFIQYSILSIKEKERLKMWGENCEGEINGWVHYLLWTGISVLHFVQNDFYSIIESWGSKSLLCAWNEQGFSFEAVASFVYKLRDAAGANNPLWVQNKSSSMEINKDSLEL